MRTYLILLLLLSCAAILYGQSDAPKTSSEQTGSDQQNGKPGDAKAEVKQEQLKQEDAKQDKIYQPGKDGVTSPVLLHFENPEMPEQLRRAHLNDDRGKKGKRFSGTVVFSGVLDTDGRIHDLRVIRSLSKEADKAALDKVKTWKFRPCTLHGHPVNCYLTAEVSFNMY